MDDGSAPFRAIEAAVSDMQFRERSAELDLTRSSPYWATPREITARSFEVWVRHLLESEGIRNDYLADLLEAEEWAAEDVIGVARYPYPLAGEMPVLDRAFSKMFGLAPLELRHAPAPAAVTRHGRVDGSRQHQHPGRPAQRRSPWQRRSPIRKSMMVHA